MLQFLIFRQFIFICLHLPRGVVAHVHKEIFAEWSFTTCAMTDAAAHQMRRGPRDLSVVADLVQIVPFVVAEFVILVFHVPHSNGKIPKNETIQYR